MVLQIWVQVAQAGKVTWYLTGTIYRHSEHWSLSAAPRNPREKARTTGLIFKYHHPSKEGVIITPFKHQGVCFSVIITRKCVP